MGEFVSENRQSHKYEPYELSDFISNDKSQSDRRSWQTHAFKAKMLYKRQRKYKSDHAHGL